MAKNSWELDAHEDDDFDHSDLGFDPYEVSRHTHRPNRVVGHKGKLTGVSAKAHNKRSSHNAKKLQQVQRLVIGGHGRLLTGAIGQVAGIRELEGVEVVAGQVGVPMLTQSQTQEAFKGNGRESDNRSEVTLRVNKAIDRYIERVNHRRPRVVTRLGELGIFDYRDPGQPGTRVVGLGLVGNGADELKDENRGLLMALSASTPGLPVLAEGYVPRLDLLTAPDQQTAEGVIELLHGAQVIPSFKNYLSPGTNGETAAITIGRLET